MPLTVHIIMHQAYKGDPLDRKAMVTHRQTIAKKQAELTAQFEKKKKELHTKRLERDKLLRGKKAEERKKELDEQRERQKRKDERDKRREDIELKLLKVPVRTACLRSDRCHNRYWFATRSAIF